MIAILALLALTLTLAGCGGKDVDSGGSGDRGGDDGAAAVDALGPGTSGGSSLTIVMRPNGGGGAGDGDGGAEPDGSASADQNEPMLPSSGSAYDPAEVAPLAVETVGLKLEPGSLAGARLAIIIDDLGGGVSGTTELMQVRAPLTVAIMPGGRHAAQEARMAAEAGFAVILHQPMEALDSTKDPGPGAITMGMSDEQIRDTLEQNLGKLDGVIGVNNHMGSRVTEDSDAVEAILRAVFSKGLFFIDSRTSSKSVVAKVASGMGARVLENSTFLDGVNTEDYIIEQIRSAAKKAHARGSAVAIGHVRPATIRALQRMLPELAASGLSLVTVDKLAPAIPVALLGGGEADRDGAGRIEAGRSGAGAGDAGRDDAGSGHPETAQEPGQGPVELSEPVPATEMEPVGTPEVPVVPREPDVVTPPTL